VVRVKEKDTKQKYPMKKENLWLSLAILPFAAQNMAAQQRPNIVFIMADQWRGDALGCLQREPVHTPNLDALAQQGVNFTQAVSSYPVSSPARGMLMSGMYPHRSGVSDNCNSESAPYNVQLRQDLVCWSDVLAAAGYETAYYGKWHLDAPHKPYIKTYNNEGAVAWNEWTIPERRHGFQRWIAYGTYDYHLRPMFWHTNDTREGWQFVDEWEPQYDVDNAVAFIRNASGERNASKPFAMVVSMNPPHTGYNLVPDRYKALYEHLNVDSILATRPDFMAAKPANQKYFRQSLADYYACMTGVDEQVGRILAALREAGLSGNTLVIFTSDHGDCMGSHNIIGKNVCYDTAMRIPMILSFPGTLTPRRDDTTLIAFADLAPTLLHLLGLKRSIPQTMQTFDLADAVMGKAHAFSPAFEPYFRLRPDSLQQGLRGLRDRRYTYVTSVNMTLDGGKNHSPFTETLFDRQSDPYGMNNIAAQHPDLCQRYRAQLRHFLKKQGDGFYRNIY
jgi:arylsulfatase A-like enzyme